MLFALMNEYGARMHSLATDLEQTAQRSLQHGPTKTENSCSFTPRGDLAVHVEPCDMLSGGLFHFAFRAFLFPVAGPAPSSSGADRLARELELDSKVRLSTSVKLAADSASV
jgi:hypothetical protein